MMIINARCYSTLPFFNPPPHLQTQCVMTNYARHTVPNNKAKIHVPFGRGDSSLPMSDLPSALMAALGAIMIMMEISQAITGGQHRAHCRHTNGLICNWERGK